jgi:tetratricopeptide (TPR) repeat protein
MNTLHLPIERLADLADGIAAPAERDHLATCARCASELDAYRRLVVMAADERRRIGPPSTSWESLRDALQGEGLIAMPGRPLRRPVPLSIWIRRAVAVAALVAGGAIAGRLSAGLTGRDAIALGSRPAAESVSDGSLQNVSDTEPVFGSAQEALEQLERAQRAYEEAALYLSEHDSSAYGGSDQYRTRLAALDMASETFQRALTDAPEDPVINQYLLATMNAREATIRRIGTTLPASMRMGRF